MRQMRRTGSGSVGDEQNADAAVADGSHHFAKRWRATAEAEHHQYILGAKPHEILGERLPRQRQQADIRFYVGEKIAGIGGQHRRVAETNHVKALCRSKQINGIGKSCRRQLRGKALQVFDVLGDVPGEIGRPFRGRKFVKRRAPGARPANGPTQVAIALIAEPAEEARGRGRGYVGTGRQFASRESREIASRLENDFGETLLAFGQIIKQCGNAHVDPVAVGGAASSGLNVGGCLFFHFFHFMKILFHICFPVKPDRPASKNLGSMTYLFPNPAPSSAKSALFINAAHRKGPYPESFKATLSHAGYIRASGVTSSWPGYAPTPLVPLSALAAQLGVANIHYKDEGGRFGLGSFKALGGAYAVFRLLAAELRRRDGSVDETALAAGQLKEAAKDITVCCATDGNHGRSVAWGARMFGARAVIFIHATVSEKRAEAIRSFGAEVVRTAGNYDDSVREADRTAAANGWFVVSDTSYPGYTDIPRDVMQGYAVMVAEALGALEAPPTHVFIQGGVGGLAAAVIAHLWETYGADTPSVVVVEPDKAACLYESARAGKPTAVAGDLDTVMAGMACGEPSVIAWPFLQGGAFAFMAIPDEAALSTMRLLASGTAGATIVGGESGVAGLAGLIVAAAQPDWRQAIGLDPASRVLLFGSEGDTDPDLYARIVGRTGDAVRAGA